VKDAIKLRATAVFARDAFRFLAFRFSHFRGIYESFSQAEEAAPRKARIGYNHEDLARKYQAELYLELDNSEYPVLYHLDRILTNDCTVLDFGGNVGIHYLRCRKYVSAANPRWIVCDVPEITNVGQKICVGLSNIAFINDIEEFNETKIDIFLASDSLQYVESQGLLLPRLIDKGIRPRHILIDQLPLYDGRKFVTLQNGGPVYYPQYVFNRDEYITTFTRLGYELVDSWDCRNFSCIVPFHPNKSVRAYTGLYFSAGKV
jgi:putative methyltransferase (TIGR04325 family)